MSSIRQIARACGVSPMTVSFVLNDAPGQVGEETRERVLRAVRELGYRPTAKKHDRSESAPCTLGIVAGVAGDSLTVPGYYNSIVASVLRHADSLQHNVTIFSNTLFETEPRKRIRSYSDGRCDGLMLIAPAHGSGLVGALRERGTPLVVIGSSEDDSVSYVDVANVTATVTLVTALAARGHTRIGFINGPAFVYSTRQRLTGYLNAMQSLNLPVDPALIADNLVREDERRAAIYEMLRLPVDRRPTAVFAWNDDVAAMVLEVAPALALRVPADLSVVGFDDDVIATKTDPPLCTVRQPFDVIGRSAARMLVRHIYDRQLTPEHELLHGELIVRGSLGAAPR